MNASTDIVTNEHAARFLRDGYFVLERAIPEAHLELLRGGCQSAIDATDREMDRLGSDVHGISRRGSRYFSINPSLDQPRLLAFIYSPLMAEICRATIGPEAQVFWEQYVVKGAGGGMHFSWHQDSGYVQGINHRPYLTCWCALDDMSEANGTIYVLPFGKDGAPAVLPHEPDPAIHDLVAYTGSEPGVPIVVPAGSIAVFSSRTLHRSGTNSTDRLRRSYLIQYSGEDIRRTDGTPWGRTEPFLRGGEVVAPVLGAD